MKCFVCKKKFKEDDRVVPIFRYVVSPKRGDFVTTHTEEYFHAEHLKE